MAIMEKEKTPKKKKPKPKKRDRGGSREEEGTCSGHLVVRFLRKSRSTAAKKGEKGALLAGAVASER